MSETPNIKKLQEEVNALQKPKTSKLPTISDLFSEQIQLAGKSEALNNILNTPPPDKWIKKHPFIKDYLYVPIDKVEYLLRRIFKKYSIEITGQGTAFNGVWVTVRVHYHNPVTGDMQFHDGIGACQLQTAKGTSPADLANINNGALSMAFPIATFSLNSFGASNANSKLFPKLKWDFSACGNLPFLYQS